MFEILPIEEFIQIRALTFDVRSPSEFLQGHLPGTHSLPLFNDEERAIIGTAYKQINREAAIDLGLKIVGPKLFSLVQAARPYLSEKTAKFLCWRGGMRSGFMARFFESIGYSTYTLEGGYKSFRRWVLNFLNLLQLPQLFVIGGLTGSGKTQMLHYLKEQGEQIIDLEELACHRGSSFGGIGMLGQPTQEQFENNLAFLLSRFDFSKPIWIEDESRMIGKIRIPTTLFELKCRSPFFYLDIAKEKRVQHLLETYKDASQQDLKEATKRITKKLGAVLTSEILALLEMKQYEKAFALLLSYYDRTYIHQLKNRKNLIHLQEDEFKKILFRESRRPVGTGDHGDRGQ